VGFQKRVAKRLPLEELKNFAMRTLGARPLSERELREKLATRATTPADVDTVLALMREYRGIDDQAFAENFSASRQANRLHGKQRVLADLRQRRIDPALARETVEKLYQDQDEAALIEAYLAKKYRGKNLRVLLQDPKQLASVVRRLATAGFTPGKSFAVLRRYSQLAAELPDPPQDVDTEPID
jgi:regulatory protein